MNSAQTLIVNIWGEAERVSQTADDASGLGDG